MYGIAKPSGRNYPDGRHPCIQFIRGTDGRYPDMYAHYFVSAQIYFEHTAFFLPRKPKTIVLANGDNQPQLAGIPTLNIYQDEKTLIRNILQLHQFGHKGGHPHSHPHGHPHGVTAHPCGNPHADSEHDLSPAK